MGTIKRKVINIPITKAGIDVNKREVVPHRGVVKVLYQLSKNKITSKEITNKMKVVKKEKGN